MMQSKALVFIKYFLKLKKVQPMGFFVIYSNILSIILYSVYTEYLDQFTAHYLQHRFHSRFKITTTKIATIVVRMMVKKII